MGCEQRPLLSIAAFVEKRRTAVVATRVVPKTAVVRVDPLNVIQIVCWSDLTQPIWVVLYKCVILLQWSLMYKIKGSEKI